MKNYLLLLIIAFFYFNNTYSQSEQSIHFTDDFFPQFALNKLSLIPQYPIKDQFENSEQFNTRVLNYKSSIEKINNTSTIKLTDVPLALKTNPSYPNENGGFKYDADNAYLRLAVRLCGDPFSEFYKSQREEWVFSSILYTYLCNNIYLDPFFSDFDNGFCSFEIEPELAKKIYGSIINNENTYSITFQLDVKVLEFRPKIYKVKYIINNYWLVNNGNTIAQYNPRNRPKK